MRRVLCFRVMSLSLKLIIVGPDPTTTRTVIGNRANHRVMVLVDGLNMFAILLVIIVVGVRRSLSNVAHPVPRLKKLNVNEDKTKNSNELFCHVKNNDGSTYVRYSIKYVKKYRTNVGIHACMYVFLYVCM